MHRFSFAGLLSPHPPIQLVSTHSHHTPHKHFQPGSNLTWDVRLSLHGMLGIKLVNTSQSWPKWGMIAYRPGNICDKVGKPDHFHPCFGGKVGKQGQT